MKIKLDCAYSISKFEGHNALKDEVLKLIDSSKYFSPVNSDVETNITKTDWPLATDMSRPWVQPLLSDFMDHMLKAYKELGYENFSITEIWFQQYMHESQHGWHVHSRNFTNVYYLEMPTDGPKTLLISPFDQHTVIEADVSEGDTMIFPSFVIHKAPKNLSNKRKTIISFNADVGYPDYQYGRGL